MTEPVDPFTRASPFDLLSVSDLFGRPSPGVASANDDLTVNLLQITSAIAEAVSAEAVHAAVVDHVARVLGASTCALWLRERGCLRLVRQVGYSAHAEAMTRELPLDRELSLPILDSFLQSQPIEIPSQEALLAAYPHARRAATVGRGYRASCFPLIAGGVALGALGLTFDEERRSTANEQRFLLLVARYATHALERLRILDAERAAAIENRRLHQEADAARRRAEQLYRFASAAVGADTLDAVFDAALTAITEALEAPRAAILLFDEDHVMRFRAWRGLSDGYRAAVDGHSPWKHDEPSPSPVLVGDCLHDPAWSSYAEVFRGEGIGALSFIPLVSRGTLLGKFMVYYDAPRAFDANDIEVSSAIANHLASMIARFGAVTDLERALRDNELFAGVLAHDLRNPLSAILTAAQLALLQNEGAGNRATKPISRIVSSAERMSTMITQLLDFTRVRVGSGIELQRCATSLLDIVNQTVMELELSHPDRELEVKASGDHEGHWDPDRLLQVVSNLVGNACQHGEAASKIAITIDGQAPDVVTVSVHNRGCIAPALLPRVFEPFRGQGRRHHARGLGLGLYIVREIARAHHGTVEVRSTEADGTTFSVRLPRA